MVLRAAAARVASKALREGPDEAIEAEMRAWPVLRSARKHLSSAAAREAHRLLARAAPDGHNPSHAAGLTAHVLEWRFPISTLQAVALHIVHSTLRD